jgi:tRNA-splicing ligase RtcB
MEKLKKISENIWEIPKEGKMLVNGIVFASDKLINDIKKDKTLEQVKNVACLPGIIKASFAMPDAHQGYGFSIGGVAAFDLKKGIISPGGVGYDINCGVRVLSTNLTKKEFLEKRKEVLHEIKRNVPSGVGRGSSLNLSKKQLNDILKNGSKWAIENNFGVKEDLEKTEDNGCIKEANPEKISDKAKSRGIGQLGTLGAGNHFLEIQEVQEIYDEKTAKAFGLEKGKITVMIHCGSRGLGHQVASDYIQLMEKEYGFKNLPDRELICSPINSKLGKDYFAAMSASANFAFVNRQIIMHKVRESFKIFFPKAKLDLIYDVAHNIAKFEEHKVDGKNQTLCIHRKGATRSFGPGRKEIPEVYRKVGQPVIIPGSMGTYSYILVGTKKAEEISFASTAHGAGRVFSRIYAKKNFKIEKLKEQLKNYDVEIEAGNIADLLEESPQAYKDVNEVVKVSNDLGIGNLVARLKPLAVIKG